MKLAGELFLFDTKLKLAAFISNKSAKGGCIVFVGGLTDGFMTVPLLEELSFFALSNDLALVQCQLSSSFGGYGTSSLKNDQVEISQLVDQLGYTRIILFGHSTGCQSILSYLNSTKTKGTNVTNVILQGNVSDRESEEADKSYLNFSLNLIHLGKRNDLMPREAHSVPITAYRYHSLFSVGGDDDMFSSDLNLLDQEEKYFNQGIPISILLSESDEYIPKSVSVESLAERYKHFKNVKNVKVLKHSMHGNIDQEDMQDFFSFLKISIFQE